MEASVWREVGARQSVPQAQAVADTRPGGDSLIPRKRCGESSKVAALTERQRIRRQTFLTHDAARADVFNYIEMFYNPKRRHSTTAGHRPPSSSSVIFSAPLVARKSGAIHFDRLSSAFQDRIAR